MTKPVTWRDWQGLYLDTSRALGLASRTYFECRWFVAGTPNLLMQRTAQSCYRKVHRIRRIKAHMDKLMADGEATAMEQIAYVAKKWGVIG